MTTSPSNPTAEKLKRLTSTCSVCGRGLDGHRFAQIASTVANEGNARRVQQLFGHVKRHQWEALKDYADFRGDQNTVIMYAITGPHGGGMVLLILDPFELYESAELYLQEQLTASEVAAILQLSPAETWQAL